METLIRLATAHAKARLSAQVTEADAIEAEAILRFALYKEVLKRQRRKKHKVNGGAGRADDGESADEEEEESDNEAENEPARMTSPKAQTGQTQDKGKAPALAPHVDPVWGEDSQDVEMEDAPAPPARAAPTDGKISADRYVDFRSSTLEVRS